MQLEELTPELFRRAVAIYDSIAFPADKPAEPRVRPEDFAEVASMQEVFARCEKREPEQATAANSVSPRYALRMGNYRYPFMKLVVQEYLVDKEYFFAVDTHDDLDIRPENPDYEGFQDIKRFNRELCGTIEAAWRRAGLPTHFDMEHMVRDLARAEGGHGGEGGVRARLLVVDDDVHVAQSLEALFSARGFVVELAHDGRAVLDRLSRDPIPDLVLLDYSMPELDGEEVLRRLRADPRLADVPVLLATASTIDLDRLGSLCGFLRKPYLHAVLTTLVSRMLEERRAAQERAETDVRG